MKGCLTAPLEHSICPYQRSLLSFRMRSRSSMPSRASSSLDLVVTSCGLTLQIYLIIALSFRCRRWRFSFVNGQVSLAWSIVLCTQELSVHTARGWSGGAKVLCILHHWGVQLILAYSWARPAILVVGKGRGGMFLFLLFLHFHSCSSFFPVPLFHLLYSLFYLFSPFLWETTQNDPQGLTCR